MRVRRVNPGRKRRSRQRWRGPCLRRRSVEGTDVLDRVTRRIIEGARSYRDRAASHGDTKHAVSATPSSSTTNEVSYDVTDVAEVGKFRGAVVLISEAVTGANRKDCIVLDMGYSTVHIVCVPSFLSKPVYDSFVTAARAEGLSIGKTVRAPERVIADLHAVADRAHRPGLATENQETRHTQLFEDLTRGAFLLGSSDIHIVLQPAGRSIVRLRRHGRMRRWKEFDTPVLSAAIAAGFQSKTRSGTNSAGAFHMDRAMSTMTQHLIGDDQVNARLSSWPLINRGCAVVMRLLQSNPKRTSFPTLTQLGYSQEQVQQIMRALATMKGLIILNGSTGSGKSTSLRSMVYEIPHWEELCIRSVEEPVEYELPGVEQASVQTSPDDPPEAVQEKFNACLKQMVRMDPDVGLVGEIRDALSAHMALQLAMTGHKAMTTLHGDSAEDALFRLIGRQFGVDPAVLASCCTLSGYQKLLPVMCPHCKVPAGKVLPASMKTALVKRYRLDLATMYCVNEEGCEHCRDEELNYGGTVGQTLAAEFISPTTAEMKAMVRAGDFENLRNHRRSQRKTGFADPDTQGKTAFEHALYKASIGLIDPRDIEADFEPLDAYDLREIVAC
ncbi:hypothetical protein FX016_23050 [Cupriavidus gilardii]|nr:hypothetical protein FX016_23050 [Cupriavidus gilardii]